MPAAHNTPAVDIYVDGAWETLPDADVERDSIVITRGTGDSSAPRPASLDVTLLGDGRYNGRNATSDLFGKFGFGTPIRVREGTEGGFYRAQGMRGNKAYAQCWTDDHASLDITGDLDVRIDMMPDMLGRELEVDLIGKWDDTIGPSWCLRLVPDDTLQFAWSTDGTTWTNFSTSTAPVPWTTSGRLTVRATIDVDDGTGQRVVRFYTGTGGVGGSFTQLGSIRTNVPTNIAATAAPLHIGPPNAPGSPFSGRVWAAQLRNGIAGTVVANPDFAALAPGTTAFTDSAGRAWTVDGPYVGATGYRFTGQIVQPGRRRGRRPNTARRVDVEAAGPLRKMGQGDKPLLGGFTQYVLAQNPVAYWPLTDNRDSTSVANLIPGAPAGTPANVTFGNIDGPPGSESLATLNGETSRITMGRLRAPSVTTAWCVQIAFKLPAAPTVGTWTELLTWRTSTGYTWQIVEHPSGSGLFVIHPDGTLLENVQIASSAIAKLGPGNGWQLATVYATQDGSDVDWWGHQFAADDRSLEYVGNHDGTALETFAGTLGYVRDIYVGGTAQNDDAGVGHVAVFAGTPAFVRTSTPDPQGDQLEYWGSFNGYRDEYAASRIRRLCLLAGIPFVGIGADYDTAPLDSQGITSVLAEIRSAAEADGGILYEDRSTGAIAYRTRASLTGQNPAAVVDYAAGHVKGDLIPAEDDQGVTNDVTLKRPFGSSVRLVQDTGPLNINSPYDDPDGIGVGYDTSDDLNVADDSQLTVEAGWRLTHGTSTEPRYPAVDLNLSAEPTRGTDLAGQLRELELGDRLDVEGMPLDELADTSRNIVKGYTETVGVQLWPWKATTVPYGPYDAGRWDTAGTVWSPSDSVTAATYAAGVTTIVVDSAAGVIFSDDADHYPIDVEIAGEIITLENAPSGTSLPQTFTGVTRAVNGIAKSLPAGSLVRIHNPKRYRP